MDGIFNAVVGQGQLLLLVFIVFFFFNQEFVSRLKSPFDGPS